MSLQHTQKGDRSDAVSPRSPWVRRLIISLTILIWMGIGYVCLTFLSHITLALILVIIAGLLAYVIYPLVHLLQRWMSRPLAVVIVYVVALGVLGLLIYSITISVVNQLVEFVKFVQFLLTPDGQKQIQPIIDGLQKVGISREQITQFGNDIVKQLQGLLGSVGPIASQIFNIFIEVIVIATLSVYLLLDGRRAISWLANKTPVTQREYIRFLIATVDKAIGGYFRGMLILATIGGVSTGLLLTFLKVPFGVLLGIIVFIFYFIPVVGGYISGPLCILLALPQGWIVTVIVALFVVLLQQIVLGQILAPRILGGAVGLHPVVAIFALFACSELFGVFGGILAVPIAGILQSLLIAFWHRWQELHPELFPLEVSEKLHLHGEPQENAPTGQEVNGSGGF